ncbi:MAG: hypothetical protein JOZ65_20855 [Chloroflexi bacterium]|nr:hypothetical protein [Chloroflexota bacterium]
MDQPTVGRREDVDLYTRTYNTVLRTSGEVRLRAFERAHINVCPALHAGSGRPEPDTGALIYAANRLPVVIGCVRRVILGQLPEHFERALGSRLMEWQSVQAPARRRQWHYDGAETLAAHVASTSDIDDVIPTLVAYQIEWNKLHARLRANAPLQVLVQQLGANSDAAPVDELREYLGINPDDWSRLQRVWGGQFCPMLSAIATSEKDFLVRLLGGTDVGYAKLTRRWWRPIGSTLAQRGLEGRPIYFVSSNLHSLVNLVSGYAPRRAQILWSFLAQSGTANPSGEAAELVALRGQANTQNVLYYAARLWHQAHPQSTVKSQREVEELERGIVSIAPVEGADVGAQLIELSQLDPADFDTRLADVAEAVRQSDAVILNIDYPLGMGAYHILRQVSEAVDNLVGVYVLGKAATLNGDIGDVLIADFVRDEHTGNTNSFDNAFSYSDVAPFLERGSVLDNQRAVTVKGTFLQNREYLDLFYRESDTVVEMEAGPYLAALFEATHVSRHPLGEAIHFRKLPLDFGLIHYASDTPYTRARTLGGRSLSFEGVDSTYAAAVAILRRVFKRELLRRT